MIELRKVDKDNYREIINMKLTQGGQEFVASNVYSLAQAWVFYESAKPLAIYNGEEVIGFMMLEYNEKEREAGIWRFMIGEEYHGKGYGNEAMLKAIEMIKNENKFDSIGLDYVQGNVVAKHLYEKLGFKETGEIEDGEIVMKLDLS